MIKIMFKPFFKKFWGLFVSMVFVSALSIAMLCAFASNIYNLEKTFKKYLVDYENVDGMVKVGFTNKTDLEGITDVEGVNHIDYRLTLDSRMKNKDGRIITSRIFSFNDRENNVFRPYVLEGIERKENVVNVSVIRKFAENNKIKVGDTIEVGYFNTYIHLFVNEIVETPEGMQARANDYVWSDGTDFGYIYVSEYELDIALEELAQKIDEKVKNDEAFKAYYEKAIQVTGIDIPSFADAAIIGKNYCAQYTNQLLISAKDGYSNEQVLENVNNFLKSKEVNIKQSTPSNQMFYILYLENCIRQLRVASVFLPVFFYSVTMIVIGLFMNQIIKAMTKEIGVMMSIGVGFKDIRSIFIVFTLLMSLAASIIGLVSGFGLNGLLTNTMRRVYSMPTLTNQLNIWFSIAACLFLVVFAELATIISCRGILRITPKDATLSNEAKRKPLPKWLAKFIDKAPMNLKLSINSIAQNFRRFFVSCFSIFASLIIILLSLFFQVSKTELMDQSVNRRLNFDAQIYYTEKIDEEQFNDLKNQSFSKEIEDCYYTYLQLEKNDNKMYIECLAYDANTTNNLVQIPSKNGHDSQKLTETGIIVPTSISKKLKVQVGDMVTINGKEIKIAGISKEYFHPIAYLSKTEMDRITNQYVSSILLNVTSESELLAYLNDNGTGALTVFTRNLSHDIHSLFNSIDVFIYIMVGFSLMMAFIILSIMGQNSLMEQKRQLTVFRAIGFTIKNISDIWTVQSVSHLVLSSLFAIPVGALSAYILFSLCSSANQMYPFIFSFKSIGFGILFILLVIIATHLISIFVIRKWNIADNTRCRE